MERHLAAVGGTGDGWEISEPIRLQESVRLASSRLDATGGGTSDGREIGTIAATLDVTAPMDSVRRKRIREVERRK